MAEKPEKSTKKRRGPGRPFQKGNSANPGGRPKIPRDVIEACRAHTQHAIMVLHDLLDSDNDAVRLKAAEALLDRAWGKATQPLTAEITARHEGQVKIFIPDNGRAPNKV